MFLGCGRKLEDGRTDPRKQTTKAITLKLHESDGRTNGRTQEKASPKNDLRIYRVGGRECWRVG